MNPPPTPPEGKVDWRVTMTLLAKEMRSYMFAHPGCTKDEIYAALPNRKYFGDAFDLLRRRGLARYEGGGKKGPAKWFAVTT